MILTARDGTARASSEALERLCKLYWFPIYTFVRSRGYRKEQAQDITQEFFVRFLEKEFLAKVRRGRGKFRSFLLASISNFLADEWDKKRAKKRGGGQQHLSLDFAKAEGLMAEVSSRERSPVELYELHWAKTVLARALGRLSTEYHTQGKGPLFEQLQPFLGGSRPVTKYRDVAAELDMTEGAVKVAAHRLRKRYRSALEDEILETLADGNDLHDELRYIMTALSG